MKNSLKFQLSFIITSLLCIAIAVISIFTIKHEKKSLMEARDLRGKLLVQSLVTTGTDAILSNNKPKLLSFCNDIVMKEDVEYAMIIDTNGIIIAHNNSTMVGKPCKSDLCLSVLKSDRMIIKPFKSKTNVLFDYSIPLVIGDKRIGSARIIMSNESIQRTMAELKKYVIAYSLILLCFSLIFTILITHFLISRPIKRLTEGVKIAATGDFNYRMNIKNNNEIGRLIKVFNKMNESLLAHKNQLSSLYNTVSSLDTIWERSSLVTHALDIVNDIIGPNQCILALIKNDNLIIKNVSGFKPANHLIGKLLSLPNDVFKKTFQKQVTRRFIAATLSDTFNNMNIELQNQSEEILISPLIHGKKSKGVFILIGKMNGKEFNESDSTFLDIISLSTAMSLFNIELLEKSNKWNRSEPESNIAELVRRVLLPQKPFQMKGIEICSYYKPAGETHGNWHGFIEDKKNRRLSVFIGDATGQGVPAVLATATANSFISTMGILRKRYNNLSKIIYSESHLKPEQKELPIPLNPAYLLSLLNHILYKNTYGKQTMTFFASTFDLVKKQIHFANAGHEIPVLIKKKRSTPEALVSSGPRLGDTDGAKYKLYSLDLESGDIIIWYTAGITKCLNTSDEPYGNRRFLQKIKEISSLSAQEICKHIVNDIHKFRKNKPLIDDITLVTAKFL